MILKPQYMTLTEGNFVFSGEISAKAHPCLNTAVIKEFWKNFTFQSSALTIGECEDYTFCIGSVEMPALDGYAYAVSITPEGVAISAESEKGLLDGYMALLDCFVAVDLENGIGVQAACRLIRDRAWTANKMVHYCIFPETELWELARFVRFCGALQYTHIVLEFWGMLKFDCMKELAWSHGYTKDQIRPIIEEAHALGMEVIPMFNHWGHASASRGVHAKHVVLDQNPMLQTYFTEDGWCWDIRKTRVKAFLHSVREELIELCGAGEYFHIGCDEAYGFALTEENMIFLCDFINGVQKELEAQGRRAIMWGDMMLFQKPEYNPNNRYSCHAPSAEVGPFMLKLLDRGVIIADWQYHAKHAPIETEALFREAGFDCLLCPWDEGCDQLNAVIDTVRERKLMGIMHTTWHTLSMGMPYVMLAAIGGFEKTETLSFPCARTNTAMLLRKVYPIGGEYRRAGTAKKQIYDKW